MKTWIDSYQSATERTRVLSLLGAGFVLVVVANKWWSIYAALSILERKIEDDLWWVVFWEFVVSAAIALAALWRLIVSSARRPKYRKLFISWLILAGTLTGYIVRDYYLRFGRCLWQNPDDICFGAYDSMSRTDHLLLASFVFLFTSLIRSVITAVVSVFLRKRPVEMNLR
jgi:hypothetical protein